MDCYTHPREVKKNVYDGLISYPLLTAAHGCTNGCCTGISIYSNVGYLKGNSHKDQEGFLVIEGVGWARVGEVEFRIEPDTSFIVPAGVNHVIKRHPDSKSVKVFWFHAAI